jgi:hypothetical protein
MNRPEDDFNVGRRLDSRVRARLYAQLVTPDQLQTVYIETLSPRGAGLRVETAPSVGAEVVLSWKAHDMAGTIIWARGHRCGVSFSDELPSEIVDAIVKTTDGGRYVRDLGAQRLKRPR